MLSKAKMRFLEALKKKKFRQKYNIFLAEGDKIVTETLTSPTINIHSIYATKEWIGKNLSLLDKKMKLTTEVSEKELKIISSLQTPNQVLAAIEIPESVAQKDVVLRNLSLVLDDIRDPGNLGTILRLADWFGLPYVFCSPGCVDPYNSKVVQAGMGAFLRVKCIETDLAGLFKSFPGLPVIGAYTGGDNIFEIESNKRGFLLIGNESQGINPDLEPLLSRKVAIPGRGGAESLNAAIATAIITAVLLNK